MKPLISLILIALVTLTSFLISSCTQSLDVTVIAFHTLISKEVLDQAGIEETPNNTSPVAIDLEVNKRLEVDLASSGGEITNSVKDIVLNSLTYSVKNNTLNKNLPAIILYAGPFEAQELTDEGVIMIGQTLPVLARTDIEDDPVAFRSGGQDELMEFIKEKKFSFFFSTTIQIEENTALPTGNMRFELAVKATFFL